VSSRTPVKVRKTSQRVIIEEFGRIGLKPLVKVKRLEQASLLA
jgi:hypothetical protein